MLFPSRGPVNCLALSASSSSASRGGYNTLVPLSPFRRPFCPTRKTPIKIAGRVVPTKTAAGDSSGKAALEASATAPKLKGIFAGSGSASMSHPLFAGAAVDLVERRPTSNSRDTDKDTDKDTYKGTYKDAPITVLYLGTATYDLAHYRNVQTKPFLDLGCRVSSLNVANEMGSSQSLRSEMEDVVASADIILVSGGNTLYAVDRWRHFGLDALIHEAVCNGAVMAGGSAGAICWFDGGHSDSMDPDTYRDAMLAKYGLPDDSSLVTVVPPSTQPMPGTTTQPSKPDGSKSASGSKPPRSNYFQPNSTPANRNKKNNLPTKEWTYIRVPGLSILPGLICPHYDRIQTNGVARMTDFDKMITSEQHHAELGIGIDHYAALLIDGDEFRVLSIPGMVGSVPSTSDQCEKDDAKNESNDSTDSSLPPNMPGVWIKYVQDGKIHSKICPRRGKVVELLQAVIDPTKLVVDELAETCRRENPPP